MAISHFYIKIMKNKKKKNINAKWSTQAVFSYFKLFCIFYSPGHRDVSFLQILTSGVFEKCFQKLTSVRNFGKIVFFDVIRQYLHFFMFEWICMHVNGFKHHFRRLYIILDHMESYKKLTKSCSKVIFGKQQSTRTMFA